MTEKSFLPSLWRRDNGDFDPFRDLHREVDRLFSEFGRGMRPLDMGFGKSDGSMRLVPQVDVTEAEDAVEVTAELPGVSEDDIEVTLNDNVLTIKGEKKSETEDKSKDRHLIERSYGMFQRSIAMPVEVKPDDVMARFDKGVLTVTLPKAPEAKSKTHKVQIKSAA